MRPAYQFSIQCHEYDAGKQKKVFICNNYDRKIIKLAIIMSQRLSGVDGVSSSLTWLQES